MKKYPYPKYVWSPSGGWWCDPPNWKRNTVVAAIISLTIAATVYVKTRKYEVSKAIDSLASFAPYLTANVRH